MLEFVNELFVNAAPNTTAWCETLEAFLGNRRYKLTTRVCFIFFVQDSCFLRGSFILEQFASPFCKCYAVVCNLD